MAEYTLSEMKDKIAKLLAKAEATTNEAEREAFTAKAEQLMVRLGIDAAELEAAGEVKPEEVIEVHRTYTGGYAIVMVPFASAVCRGFGNLTTLQSVYRSSRRVYIIGHKSDVEMVMQLLDSLETQAKSAMHRWQKTAPERQWQDSGQRYVGSRTFLQYFGFRVGDRLKELRQETQQEASPGAALVLVSKKDRVDDWTGKKYPKLKKSRTGARTYNSSAAGAGVAAGNRASLGEKAIGENFDELA